MLINCLAKFSQRRYFLMARATAKKTSSKGAKMRHKNNSNAECGK